MRFTAGRGILREILSRYTGRLPSDLEFGYGPAGKPFLLDNSGAPSPLEFNLAHSHGLAIYGVAFRAAIGVDIERIRDGVEIEKLAARFFTPAEARALSNLPEPERRPAFFRAWTRKEAFLKALGQGLRAGLASCEVALEAGSGDALLSYRGDPQESRRWRLQDVQLHPEYCAAVAVAERSADVRCWEWPGISL
ncbi:MAG: 4'-phosphopantetheinyl transferase superfamily protein [Bryobacteraceae bacterium]|nr:4'-phosphopantetheinyl transferase superfamily protein [Bryobacteraceae bacterium]